MEQELQMQSCLFGGPPVREDIIKLGESQIGFMNIFARPLFEAVTDILPAMQFAVDEILANKAVWESKIDDERKRRRKNPNLALGLLAPSFSVDATPSPLSGGPTRPITHIPGLPAVRNATNMDPTDEVARRGSTGSTNIAADGSRRSSQGGEKGSRRSSVIAITGHRGSVMHENQGSRRGSGDASLTAILVTQKPGASDSTLKEAKPNIEDQGQEFRKDGITPTASKKKEKDNVRPVTAPSQARRSQGKPPDLSNPHLSHQPDS